MLETLKERVLKANKDLTRHNIVILTWGNASAITEDRKYVVIKPSGLDYDAMKISDLVVVDLEGNIIEGERRPSTDLKTHLEIYRKFRGVFGIVHTHSINATAFAQAGKEIPVLGTTHADHFYKGVPCTRLLTAEEVNGDYEQSTGNVIVETFNGQEYIDTPGVLVAGHGPFVWGKSPEEAVLNAVVLEEIAAIALKTYMLNCHVKEIPEYIRDKHYQRKHGAKAYYGQ